MTMLTKAKQLTLFLLVFLSELHVATGFHVAVSTTRSGSSSSSSGAAVKRSSPFAVFAALGSSSSYLDSLVSPPPTATASFQTAADSFTETTSYANGYSWETPSTPPAPVASSIAPSSAESYTLNANADARSFSSENNYVKDLERMLEERIAALDQKNEYFEKRIAELDKVVPPKPSTVELSDQFLGPTRSNQHRLRKSVGPSWSDDDLLKKKAIHPSSHPSPSPQSSLEEMQPHPTTPSSVVPGPRDFTQFGTSILDRNDSSDGPSWKDRYYAPSVRDHNWRDNGTTASPNAKAPLGRTVKSLESSFDGVRRNDKPQLGPSSRLRELGHTTSSSKDKRKDSRWYDTGGTNYHGNPRIKKQ